ncbi:hypothetical protein KR767_17685 [Luteibacter anthropi]|uniref:Uncharacterized protein n=1 Tax=Luteibacter anthropi TaxID=564369 RepID=A0A7X5ZHD6_9GAMM|nr:hypothetical protein [Luteibacter anthropi]NII05631.1 hypothetical protein [Luteibacter anthropi]URX61864.1 hypothetical protein KR767_17685 [Luteibacter anthropi]
MRRAQSNSVIAGCADVRVPLAHVKSNGLPILARAKLSALRARGKSLAGYSPPSSLR